MIVLARDYDEIDYKVSIFFAAILVITSLRDFLRIISSIIEIFNKMIDFVL